MQKENKGITLIALVITIIVMLILVGVTISVSLKGGLFSRANEATTQIQIAQEREQLLTATLGVIGIDGKINLNDLDNNLPDNFTKLAEGEYESSTGNKYKVTEDGEVILLDGTEEEPDTPVTPPATPTITLSTTQISKEITKGISETVQITATLNNASGDLTWTSSDTSIAEISGSGTTRTIILKKAGTAVITVKYGTQAIATCTIIVTEKQISVEEDELAGTWVFNETITLKSSGTTYNLEFTAGSESFSSIIFSTESIGPDIGYRMYYIYNYGASEFCYEELHRDLGGTSAGWEWDYCRTITITTRFEEMENGEEFLAWLIANATKQ